MAMTRKDYVLVAKAFASQRDDIKKRGTIALRTLEQSIETMAAHFALVNDNFNKEVFLEAARGENSNS
jgi:hypothetical protein